MPQPIGNTLAMRFLLVAAAALFFPVAPALALTDFNGHWVLDLSASSSPETVLKRLGASWIERQLGGVVQLQATYRQTPDCGGSGEGGRLRRRERASLARQNP
jgi:hypothetical protein